MGWSQARNNIEGNENYRTISELKERKDIVKEKLKAIKPTNNQGKNELKQELKYLEKQIKHTRRITGNNKNSNSNTSTNSSRSRNTSRTKTRKGKKVHFW